MARPPKCRFVCSMPEHDSFAPAVQTNNSEIVMTLDEYETIRLIDFEGMEQESCSRQMDVARTTVQAIYTSARKKLADCLINGKSLRIAGGDVTLCNASQSQACKICRNTCKYSANVPLSEVLTPENYRKTYFSLGDNMKIAVTYENGSIFQHFDHTAQFKLYEIENGKVTNSSVADTNGSGHGALAVFLKNAGVTSLICGGIGGGAKTALADAGITLYGGCSGNADDAVQAFLAGNLSYNPDVKRSHHEHEHGEGRSCGEHHSCRGSC